SRSVPVVFASLSDPVEGGFVQSPSHPGGNVTGFINFESDTAAKWVELLKETAPEIARAIVLRQSETPGLLAMERRVQEVAPRLSIQVTGVSVDTAGDIEKALESLAVEPNSGLIVLPGPILAHRELIIRLAARLRLPQRSLC